MDTTYDIVVNDIPAVAKFIEEQPKLHDILAEAGDVIDRYFPDATLRLEVSEDPEETDLVELVVWIQTDLGSYFALDQLHRLNGDPWLCNARRIENRFMVSMEPK